MIYVKQMDSKSSLVPLTLSASATFSKPGKRTRVMVRTFSFRLFTLFLYLSLVKNKNKQKSIMVLDCTVRSVSLHAVPYPNSRYAQKKSFIRKLNERYCQNV